MLLRIDRLAVVAALALVAAGCPDRTSHTGPAKEKLPFKLGIMTGTVSQGEDEYRGAEAVMRKYEPVIHVTYPDNFMTEQETTISQLKALADDPEVKAIVVAQAIPGTIAAIQKIRDIRDDIAFILIGPHEDPAQVARYGSLCLNTDELRRGETIVRLAKRLGARKLVHYSFPRHMSMDLLARRRDIMADTCKKEGMEFVSVNAPDPTGDQGLPGAQKFILEDVPRQVAAHGKDTAFFSTNCGMQEPLIRAVFETGAIFPEQCCPSPTHGYPGALGLAIDEKAAGDFGKIREAIAAKVAEKGRKGRFATWPTSMTIAMIEASVDLAVGHVRDKKSFEDSEWVKSVIEKAGGVKLDLKLLDGKKNYPLVIAESVVF
jgi:hypothetical protein